MKILVTICARGGSKGVKNKNIREIAGKPLIYHSIAQAIKWGRADEIVVSTDSDLIADVARQYDVSVPFMRPDELANDTAGKVPVIRHAHEECEKHFSTQFDLVVDLDVSAPIRKVSDIEACYQQYLKQKPLTLFSVVEAHKNPYFNMVEMDEEGWAHLSKGSFAHTRRRQDAPKVYDINASIYFYNRDFLTGSYGDNVVTERSAVCEMDAISGFDIDSEMDLKYVEFLIQEGYFTPYE